jgi:hypothetical protein
MNVGRLTAGLGYSLVGALALTSVSVTPVWAQDGRTNVLISHNHESASDQRNQSGALIKLVKESTERFKDPAVADAEGYKLMFGCVSGSDSGAMGLHFVNMPLVMDPELDPTRPEIVIYEPLPNGRLRLIGADFLVDKRAWDTAHPEGTPQIMGQLLHLFESPNRFGLDPFYTLHVWAWKDNPNGAFVNWHPKVNCEAFEPR